MGSGISAVFGRVTCSPLFVDMKSAQQPGHLLRRTTFSFKILFRWIQSLGIAVIPLLHVNRWNSLSTPCPSIRNLWLSSAPTLLFPFRLSSVWYGHRKLFRKARLQDYYLFQVLYGDIRSVPFALVSISAFFVRVGLVYRLQVSSLYPHQSFNGIVRQFLGSSPRACILGWGSAGGLGVFVVILSFMLQLPLIPILTYCSLFRVYSAFLSNKILSEALHHTIAGHCWCVPSNWPSLLLSKRLQCRNGCLDLLRYVIIKTHSIRLLRTSVSRV